MVTFTIKAKALAAVLPHLSKDNTRPLLHGFALLANGQVTATDGFTLALYRDGHTHTGGELVLSAGPEVVKLAKKAAKADSDNFPVSVVVTLDIRDSDSADNPDKSKTFVIGNGTLSACGLIASVEVMAGPFPMVAQLFPFSEDVLKPVDGILFDTSLLARFGPKVQIRFWGTDRAMVVQTADTEFVGLLMPLRKIMGLGEDRAAVDAWIRYAGPVVLPPAVEEPAAA